MSKNRLPKLHTIEARLFNTKETYLGSLMFD